MKRLIVMTVVTALVLVACGSGPSPETLESARRPSTTTTTEPPPEGIVVVIIKNGRFSPSNLELDLENEFTVRWENQDFERDFEYQIISRTRGDFESPVLKPGDSWEFDFRTLEPAVHRYNTFLGNQRIPGQVDTRPQR